MTIWKIMLLKVSIMNYLFNQLNPGACKTYLIKPENSKDVGIVDPVIEHL